MHTGCDEPGNLGLGVPQSEMAARMETTMKLRTKLMMFTAAAALSANIAFAAINPQALADAYIKEGYTYVEVKVGPTQTKLEAVKGDRKVEVIYDNASGKPIKTEFEDADDDYAGKSGVEIEDTDRDFTDSDDADDDEGEDDEVDGDDDEGDDDDESDDDESDDDDGDDDESDDDEGDDDESDGGDDDGEDGGDDDGEDGGDDSDEDGGEG
jgi:hypothetical protein